MPEEVRAGADDRASEVQRIKQFIRSKLEAAKPGRNGGLIGQGGVLVGARDALNEIIDQFEKELNQVDEARQDPERGADQ